MNWILGIIGGIAGAVAGYFLFDLFYSQGYYALAIPGAAIGLGGGWMSRMRSIPFGVLCGVVAMLFGLYIEWAYFYAVNDVSVGDFIGGIGEIELVTWLMVGIGAVVAFSLGQGRVRIESASQGTSDSD